MVDRCVCAEVTFRTLLELYKSGVELDALKERTGCCTGCTTCEPYVRLTLKTGQTSFPVLSPRECAAAMQD
jgi:NAD(P)H-nitrite reductase large subunit